MKQDKPILIVINKVVKETERVKSFYFDTIFPTAKPGQFVMTWIPGYDELPFGIINSQNQTVISVAAVGEATRVLHTFKKGDTLGMRGPYGSSFHVPAAAKRIALVAGGYGVVPLMFLAHTLQPGMKADVFLGARSRKELLFMKWFKKLGVSVYTSTDDGSAGYKGFNTDLFMQKLKKNHYDYVATVGPEIMEYKVANICYKEHIPFDVSIERYMKCGIGVCGSCCVDKTGWRMCVEGPVINHVKLKKITEFGKYHRSASGTVEYFPWIKQ